MDGKYEPRTEIRTIKPIEQSDVEELGAIEMSGYGDYFLQSVNDMNMHRIEGRLIFVPKVPDRDMKNVRDFIIESIGEWVDDPSVGLFGPNENEQLILKAIVDGLE